MFKIAHISSKKTANQAALSDFQTGTGFVKGSHVKIRLTNKELSLLLGIAVAIIVLLVIWLNPISGETSDIGNTLQPAAKLQGFKIALQKIQVLVQLFL